ncbi:MAG: UvrD-helicase domain-containing protein, partial [Prosthecobacter sp.]|nr:UvrD-helicase domain-containing protein [Prosthecobacter sp.]
MPSPAPLTHLLISASAGAGKTYQLVQRYLHLLALGEQADGIAAMTFTRKAAGEFFSRILQRLADLAESPEGAAAYFKGAEPPIAVLPDFQAMLRRVTRRMHRLRLGTMDSFFGHIAACFPLELGLPAGARVMDEDEAALARRDALEAMLERLYIDDATEALQLLLEAYKQATFGAEEKSVDASLQEWAASGLALWEDSGATPGDIWGNAPQIWPAGTPARRQLQPIGEILEALQAHFKPNHKNGIRFLDELVEQAPRTMPGLPMPDRVTYFLKKCQDAWAELQQGQAELSWGAKMTVAGPAAQALVGLAEGLMAREFLVRAERTRGLANLMTLFSAEYDRGVRARGRLSFADVQRLLCKAATGHSPWMQGGGDLWFRMDGRHQHWLLDEFQDTSRVQWRVISGLVDEVIQDADGQRSFFAVGDPKQSIYLWRQAEPGLFDDILAAYPTDGVRGLQRKPLFESHRSAQPVLDAVNAVFGDAAALEALLPAQSTKGFSFQPHVAVHKDLTGCAALLSPAVAGGGEEALTTIDITAALLKQIEPLRRGLSCAILVRQNKDAQAITEELRALTGMEVVCESDQHPCTDNVVTLALLSLLTLAAHPGDHLALEHLKMSPLWPQVAQEGGSWRYAITVIQSLIFESGFAAFLEAWAPRLAEVLPQMDAFHSRRLAQMADIAAEFDATGNRDIDAFIEFAREYPLRTRGARRAIQVMTV